jgi:hypothetical protein
MAQLPFLTGHAHSGSIETHQRKLPLEFAARASKNLLPMQTYVLQRRHTPTERKEATQKSHLHPSGPSELALTTAKCEVPTDKASETTSSPSTPHSEGERHERQAAGKAARSFLAPNPLVHD